MVRPEETDAHENEVTREAPRTRGFCYTYRMPNALKLWLGTLALAAVSLLAAFFAVFNSVFSDVFGAAERLGTYAYVGVTYFVLGFIAGLIGPGRVRRWTWILSVPAVAILVLYTFSEPQNAVIHFGFALLVPLAALAGARGGSRMREKKTSPPATK